MENERQIILETLLAFEKKEQTLDSLIRAVLSKYTYLDRNKRSFINRVTKGSIERYYELDHIIGQFSKTPVNKLRPVIHNILLMSIYQMKYMDHVPVSAICNEAVKLTEKKGFKSLKAYVNGVLRNISRNLPAVRYPDRKEDLRSYLKIKYSCGEYIIDLLLEQYGEDICERILEDSLKERPICIRCNLSKGSMEDLKSSLSKDNISFKTDKRVKDALYLENYDLLENISAFKEGRFNVQDMGSILVTKASAIKEGDKVIDVCAAPGGKTCHAADILKGSGQVLARDISDKKVSYIKDNVARCGFKNIRTKVWDARVDDEELYEKFDVVIADLPCSGLGVMARRVDLKYRIDKEAVDALVSLQRNILTSVCKYVKKGGCLIFSTCTVNKLENIENLYWIRENLPLASEAIEGEEFLNFNKDSLSEGYLQLLPGIDNSDGFFISRFKRI
ncbi:MAG: 16S rRNA (cytosine(967)-C(5))-methyltransferase RsmB [Lachnospiraceae bacterium]|nr:16S rRNA (cytosine(967)-C(5))-methyltransferase RsmB [Lachnospiraceae bacterium]